MWYLFFVFKQKTAYEMRISNWSSDVCSSDLDPTGESASWPPPPWRPRPSPAQPAEIGLAQCWVEEWQPRRKNPAKPSVFGLDRAGCRPTPASSSEERRVGKEGVSTCRSRGSPDH